MAVKLPQHSFVSSSSSNPWLSKISVRTTISCKRGTELNYLSSYWGNSRSRCVTRPASLECGTYSLHRLPLWRKKNFQTSRRFGQLFLLASAEDGVTVNKTSLGSTGSEVEGIRVKLNKSLQDEEYSDGLVQSIHDAARVCELAINEQNSLSKLSWFSTAWLGIDRNAWVKALSYQVSIYSLLQAAGEISSRGNGRDRDINVFVQRSLIRQSAPLEELIRDKLSTKQPEAYEWFWSHHIPQLVASFVNYFEEEPDFIATTSLNWKGKSLDAGRERDISLLILALTCIAAITKLGPAKVSCSKFFSLIQETTGRLMDMLVDFIPIDQAYHSIKNIGLSREFLVHFGPRAAASRVKNDGASDEVAFWVDLIQKQLQRAINREKIWSRLTTSESIEVLEKDLAIFGFFIALGRSTRTFLSANGFNVVDEPIEAFVRYLIGGSVLYYPQLSSISSYQLYVEVVCEELDWITFYPGNMSSPLQTHGHGSKREGPPNADAIPHVLNVCSHWMQSFIKYSKWFENHSNVKAARFLSRGHNKLLECMEELGISKNGLMEASSSEKTQSDKESDSFDKALESVEEALIRLELLLQKVHISSSLCGKEQLKAACSDLEKIRKLKTEAEFLEASCRAKAASLQQGDDDESNFQATVAEQNQYLKGKNKRSVKVTQDSSSRDIGKSHGVWRSFMRSPARKVGPELSAAKKPEDDYVELDTGSIGDDVSYSESNEVRRFELLRNELIELEKRVQGSTDQTDNEEDGDVMDDCPDTNRESTGTQLVQVQKKDNILEKSFEKLKETSTDVFQGTQLLAIDVSTAVGLIKRVLVRDELTEKEKKALRRTMTDLASVVPISILMLLPVTAIGHAAMLAAIQRYVPALIPSTYGPERLELLRQLEKVKEMQTIDMDPELENTE